MKSYLLLLAISFSMVASAKKQVCLYTNEGKEICYEAEKIDSIYFFEDTPNLLNLHEYVDLDLPSGTKWSTTNIGAKTPEEFGDFFFWGGTKGQKVFSKSTTLTYNLELEEMIEKGYCDKDGILTKEYDAANCNWGDGWRMPTIEECEELIQNTTRKQTEINGIVGIMYTSKNNGNSIFFVFVIVACIFLFRFIYMIRYCNIFVFIFHTITSLYIYFPIFDDIFKYNKTT